MVPSSIFENRAQRQGKHAWTFGEALIEWRLLFVSMKDKKKIADEAEHKAMKGGRRKGKWQDASRQN